MPQEGLRELFIDELKDLYNAENQLVKALPKMAKGRLFGRSEGRLHGASRTDERPCCAAGKDLQGAR